MSSMYQDDSQERLQYFRCYTDISELNDGIILNPFPDKKYGQGHHIGPLGVPYLHPRSQEHPP